MDELHTASTEIPYSPEAEQCVLGACLTDRTAVTALESRISRDAFYQYQNRLIYAAIRALYADQKPIDFITVTNLLRSMNQLDDAGTTEYILGLCNSFLSMANIDYYIDILVDKSIQRKAIVLADKLKADILSGKHPTLSAISGAEMGLLELTSSTEQRSLTMMDQVMKETMDEIMRVSEQGSSGISTGFWEIDKILAMLKPEELILIAARPGMGKTTFALNIAKHAAEVDGKKVAFFSLEMSRAELGKKLVSHESDVQGDVIRTGGITAEHSTELWDASSRLSETTFAVDDTPKMSVETVRTKAKIFQQTRGLDVLFIDYMQIMRPDKSRDNRQEEMAEITGGLKALAKELKIPVVAMAQLNRELEKRPNKRPMLSDLRESGSLEQDADVVLCLYREGYYQKDKALDDGVTEVIVAKQRNGATGTIYLLFEKEYSRFVQLQGVTPTVREYADEGYRRARKDKQQ
jgi:replicative DNA helicase